MIRSRRSAALIAAAGMVIASCGGGSDSSAPAPSGDTTVDDAPTDTEPSDDSGAGADSSEGDSGAASGDADPAAGADDDESSADTTDEADDGDAPDDSGSADAAGVAALGPPTGEPIVIGMVNTEGVPGLDFPDLRTDTDLAIAYLNEHGGLGNRPIEIIHCATAGSPETSQSCAQDLTGQGVELVMLGLDLFPGYDTYSATDTPVFGAVPILPGDYTADALFLSGGNAITMAAIVALAVEHIGAESVGIISADNPGANSSLASLTASLDKAGLSYVSVKGGDNETDAGFQGLMREATSGDPDLLVSLYDDAGCIGSMRGRASLSIDTPAVTTGLCASANVIDLVGADANGWFFVGAGGPTGTPASEAFGEIIEPVYGEGTGASLGIGALGIQAVMTVARVANQVLAEGGDVTGQAIHDRLLASDGLEHFPNGDPVTCDSSDTYPSVCSFETPIGQIADDGTLESVPGFVSTPTLDYLP